MIISYNPSPSKAPKQRSHPEQDQQEAFVQFLELEKKKGRVILFSASPASTPTGHKEGGKWVKHYGSNIRNHKMGVRPGVPDIDIILKDMVLGVVRLHIEFKAPSASPSDLSKEQLEWIAALNKLENTYACVAFSCEQAIRRYEDVRHGCYKEYWMKNHLKKKYGLA